MRWPGSLKVVDSFADASALDVAIRPARRKKRPAPFSMRFSDEERAELDRRRGVLSLAAYIRLELFSADEVGRAKPSRTFKRKHYAPSAELSIIASMLSALGQSRLAANMNQIAKAANIGTLPLTPELTRDLNAACVDIASMRKALLKALGLRAN